MVGAGTVNSLLWTFLRLRKTCKHASMSITSDSDSDNSLTVSLKMVLAGQTDQAPRRGGRMSSTQERGPGTRAPHPAPPAHPAAPAPAATAPVTAKRSKNRGPGALLRDERRRLGRIEPGLFAHETGVEGEPALPLAHRGRIGDPALPHTAPRPSPRPIVILAARKRKGPPIFQTFRQKERACRPPSSRPGKKEVSTLRPPPAT